MPTWAQTDLRFTNNTPDAPWAISTNWSPGQVPTSVDTVTISRDRSVLVDAAGATAAALTLGDGTLTGGVTISGAGRLTTAALVAYAGSNIAINGGGQITSASASAYENTTFTLTGAGSQWTNSGNFDLGYNTNLTVSAGAQLRTATSGSVGGTTGGSVITVTGSGTSWTHSRYFDFYDVTLLISDQATVSHRAVTLSALAAPGAVVTVQGGATWSVTSLKAGVAVDGGNHAALTVDAGMLNATRDVELLQGTTLAVTNGGKLNLNTASGFTTVDTGSSVSLSGAGSALTSAGDLALGFSGIATFSVRSGATTSIAGIDAGWGGATTMLLVDGAGSKLTASADVYLNGVATLTLSGGGQVDAQGGGFLLGYGNVGLGAEATVTGANSLLATADLAVGAGGVGTLNILNGGKVTSSSGALAYGAGGAGLGDFRGTVNVSGADSRWTIANDLAVGYYSSATEYSASALNLTAGGHVSVGDGFGTAAVYQGSTLNIGTGGVSGTLSTGIVRVGGTLLFDHTNDMTFDGQLWNINQFDYGAVIKQGSGTLTLSANSGSDFDSYTGPITVKAGMLAVSSDSNLGASFNAPVADRLILDGGTLRATATFALDAERGIKLRTAGGAISVDVNRTLTYEGAITGSGGLTKAGTGTLVFGVGGHAYSGTTTISAGTVRIGNYFDSAFGSGSVMVDTNGTLTGFGGFTGALRIAGTLTPGSTALFSVDTIGAGLTTLVSGGRYVWQINDALMVDDSAGIGSDLLAINGTLDLSLLSVSSRFTIALQSRTQQNQMGGLYNFDAARSYSFILATTTGGIAGFSAGLFTLDTSGFSNALNGGLWSLGQSGSNLVLNFTPASAIPEPSVYAALAGVGVLALAIYQRRAAGKLACS